MDKESIGGKVGGNCKTREVAVTLRAILVLW